MRTTKVKFLKKYLSEGMSDPLEIIRPMEMEEYCWSTTQILRFSSGSLFASLANIVRCSTKIA